MPGSTTAEGTAGEPITELSRNECLLLLRTHRVGRVAVTARALPAILPVNYALDGNSIVFRTHPGGLLDRACRSSVVAFEVDDLRDDGEGGVSVLLVGVADAVSEAERLRCLRLTIPSAVGSDADHFVRITPGTITGRRVG